MTYHMDIFEKLTEAMGYILATGARDVAIL